MRPTDSESETCGGLPQLRCGGATTDDTSSPSRFGRLEVVRSLGRGQMGEVFEAWDPERLERVVVKRMRPQSGSLSEMLRFLREANVMKRLAHPNIMPLLRLESTADPPYFVMPYKEGVTVADRLRMLGRLPSSLTARIGRDVSLALSEIHSRRFVHRDVKPANLLLERTGRTLVLDFGLARSIDSALDPNEQGEIVGTPAYMAPEQCEGEVAGPEADIYSLGVTLSELILGENPLTGDDVLSTLKNHKECVPARLDLLCPRTVSPELGRVIELMLRKDRADRPTATECWKVFSEIARRDEIDSNAETSTRLHRRPRIAG